MRAVAGRSRACLGRGGRGATLGRAAILGRPHLLSSFSFPFVTIFLYFFDKSAAAVDELEDADRL